MRNGVAASEAEDSGSWDLPQQRLLEFVERYARLFILTGAGCSTQSGIPDYRDVAGG
jgi:hypothetical protein